jgi:hypothetical protein
MATAFSSTTDHTPVVDTEVIAAVAKEKLRSTVPSLSSWDMHENDVITTDN